jgi:hypothetical protein
MWVVIRRTSKHSVRYYARVSSTDGGKAWRYAVVNGMVEVRCVDKPNPEVATRAGQFSISALNDLYEFEQDMHNCPDWPERFHLPLELANLERVNER